MNVTSLSIPDVRLVEPRLFPDSRGYVGETFSAARYAAHGIEGPFVQDNIAHSRRGVLRGLHLQHPSGQAKLVFALAGMVFDVAVDVRVGSPTFGRWTGATLSAENRYQLYLPAGFAHGFVVLSDEALVAYKCSAPYRPDAELGIAWDDPALAIEWPVTSPHVSPRDASAPRLAEIPTDRLPRYQP